MVTSFNHYVRRIFFGSLSLVLVFAGIFLLLGHKPWARGVVLGGAASLAGLVLMARDVRRQGAVAEGQVVRPGYGNYALRMFLIAAALTYAAISAGMALWATISAIFTAQFVMTLGEVLEGKRRKPL
jgi:hypothetical protein